MFKSGFSCVLFPLLVWLLRKLVLGKKKKNWATKWALKYRGPTGPVEPTGPGGVGLGPAKKIRFLIGPGSGRGSRLAGRARVWKNPARTWPVAIPRDKCERSAKNQVSKVEQVDFATGSWLSHEKQPAKELRVEHMKDENSGQTIIFATVLLESQPAKDPQKSLFDKKLCLLYQVFIHTIYTLITHKL